MGGSEIGILSLFLVLVVVVVGGGGAFRALRLHLRLREALVLGPQCAQPLLSAARSLGPRALQVGLGLGVGARRLRRRLLALCQVSCQGGTALLGLGRLRLDLFGGIVSPSVEEVLWGGREKKGGWGTGRGEKRDKRRKNVMGKRQKRGVKQQGAFRSR